MRLRQLALIAGAAAAILTVPPSLRARQAPELAGIEMIDLDGYAVRIQILGFEDRVPGTPVVVFEAGATNSLEIWSDVLPQVAGTAPVIAYDRAGLGQSEWDGEPPTPRHVADRLRRLLDEAGAAPPYVLVGYSWGGVLSGYFSQYYPADVAGLVLVDPGPLVTTSPEDNLAPFNAIGAGRSGYEAYWNAVGSLFQMVSPAARAEFETLRSLVDLEHGARSLPPIPEVPVAAVVAAKHLPLAGLDLPFDPEEHFRADLQHRLRILQEWTADSPQATIVLSNEATHQVPREAPDLIVWSVSRVLSRVTW
jgi:pimeloyl-ACP methyl ester carboxylesterase